MFGLVIAVCAGVALLLFAIDRAVKARARARWRRTMSDRLAVASRRAEQHEVRREAVAQASKEPTSVLPAIQRSELDRLTRSS